ncbi:NAD(P)-dependent benzaldehyde dehydrogenase MdlD [Flavobacterium sp. FlaQc-48]|uniref:NAD(P)-dependent benzaldehyde dehydrogenase MdlD n=1 Tax=Flavobacterium sp. FlaQc-48 TaxID=3374181 RepID=UPI00375813BC
MMNSKKIEEIFQSQKDFFATQKTQSVPFRKAQLMRLREVFISHTDAICEALWTDLGKNRKEAQYAEVQLVVEELDYCIENMDQWAKPQEVPSKSLPSGDKVSSKVTHQPYGVIYIIGPFNYPVQLTFSPLIGALMTGNTVIVKPSENTPATAAVIENIISEAFSTDYAAVVQGGTEENILLLGLPFDYIFFTGSAAVGRIVMEAAAKHLTPLTLELGGKSPTIVHLDADLDKTAERISRGKWANCGQTCVAPDYVYVHQEVKEAFIEKMKDYLEDNYQNESLGKIGRVVSQKQIKNLAGYIESSKDKLIYGGKYDLENRFFEATLLDNVTWGDAVMQQEIFGPILPILSYTDVNDVLKEINSRPKPLALYVFSQDQAFAENVLSNTSSGDAEINSTLIHVGSHFLPFGGVGASGFGKYHGRFSFGTFSHQRSVLQVK